MNRDQLIEQYKLLHSSIPSYGNGATFGKRIAHIIDGFGVKTALDFGCGKGNLINKIKQYCGARVYGYDPAVHKYNDSSLLENKYDLLIANDVLEHLHPDEYLNELEKIITLSSLFFFNISCRPATHKLPSGENCHTIIQTPEWWIAILKSLKLSPIIKEYNTVNKNLVLCLYKSPLSLKLIGKETIRK